MRNKKLFCLIGAIIILSMFNMSCNKKESDPVGTKPQCSVKPTSTAQLTPTQSAQATQAPNNGENNSPWKLLSSSSVTTSMFYAGFLNENIGVAVGYEGAVSYTTDGGKNWTVSDVTSSCRYGLDYYDENFLVTGGNTGVNMISKDKGKTWSKLGEFPLKGTGEFNRFVSVIDKKNIFLGAPQALAVSKDGGKTWKEIDVPKDCRKIVGTFFFNPQIGYVLGKDGTLYKTTDSCKTWTTQKVDLKGEKIMLEFSMPTTAINFQNENDGMIVLGTQSHQMLCLKTSDGGKSWETINMPKAPGLSPYLTRDGKFLTISALTKEISLFQLSNE